MVEHRAAQGQGGAAALDAVFGALADPTRRSIVDALSRGESSLSELAQPFSMSLPAVAKHVDVLERAGLVVHVRVGREKRHSLVTDQLESADGWIRRYARFWSGQLAGLDRYLTPSPGSHGQRRER